MSNTTNQVSQRASSDVASQDPSRALGSFLQPPVDIFEDADGIMLEADMPGVSKERLHIHVEGDNLTVEGQMLLDLPQQAQALHADVRSTKFHCSFALSRELQADQISAQLKDGVLQLRIPKRPESKPRRIEVQS